MEYRDFTKLLDELRDYYGEKAIPPKVGSTIFRVVQDLTAGEFSQVINIVIETTNRAPTPAVIKQAALPLLAKARERAFKKQIEDLEKLGRKCDFCEHTGFVTALLKVSPRSEFSFRCPNCPATKVRRHSEKIAFWSNDLKEKYVLVPVQTEAIKKAMDLQQESRRLAGNGDKHFGFTEKELLNALVLFKREDKPRDWSD